MTDLNVRRRLSLETNPGDHAIRIREASRYDLWTLTIAAAVVFAWALTMLRSFVHLPRLIEYPLAALPAALADLGIYLWSLRHNPERDVVTYDITDAAFDEAHTIATEGTPREKDTCARLVLAVLGRPSTPEDYRPKKKKDENIEQDEVETV